MEIRFEDHPQFHRAAALAVLGGATLAAFAPRAAMVPAAVAGTVFALAVGRGIARTRSRLAIGLALALAAGAVALASAALPALAGWAGAGACGAVFGLWIALALLPLHVRVKDDAIELLESIEARLLSCPTSGIPVNTSASDASAPSRSGTSST